MGKQDLPAEVSASAYNYPDALGHFGPYGGVFVAETLIAALDAFLDWPSAAKPEFCTHRHPRFTATLTFIRSEKTTGGT